MAKPVAPETGPFYGTAQATGASSASNATFRVSKAAGGKLGVEVTITPLALTCQTSGGESSRK